MNAAEVEEVARQAPCACGVQKAGHSQQRHVRAVECAADPLRPWLYRDVHKLECRVCKHQHTFCVLEQRAPAEAVT